MSEPLMWAGLPVRLVNLQPRYQVIVDEIGIGEVQSVTRNLWQWRYYENRLQGHGRSRRSAVRAVLAAHAAAVESFAAPSNAPEKEARNG